MLARADGAHQCTVHGPGIDSQQVLEMSNLGPAPLAVVPGTLICQFIFQRMDGEEHYAGRFLWPEPEQFLGGSPFVIQIASFERNYETQRWYQAVNPLHRSGFK